MLPAANRMRKAADFTLATRSGVRASAGPVVVHVAAGHDGPPRVGLVVSKAVGNSVARHRVSRRIRGAVSGMLAVLPPGALVVVRALPGAGADPMLGKSVTQAVARGLARSASGA